MRYTITDIQKHFENQRNSVDAQSYDMIQSLIEKFKDVSDELIDMNRHYMHKYCGGSLDVWMKDNSAYITKRRKFK